MLDRSLARSRAALIDSDQLHADLRAYRKQVGQAPSKEFEVRFFSDQVLLLDYMFAHQFTGIER